MPDMVSGSERFLQGGHKTRACVDAKEGGSGSKDGSVSRVPNPRVTDEAR
jgi:hypothetical protein